MSVPMTWRMAYSKSDVSFDMQEGGKGREELKRHRRTVLSQWGTHLLRSSSYCDGELSGPEIRKIVGAGTIVLPGDVVR